jgi:hypothetical protein
MNALNRYKLLLLLSIVSNVTVGAITVPRA